LTLFTLDTNVISAILRGDLRVGTWMEERVGQGHAVTLNAISYYETRRGLGEEHQSRRRRFDILVAEAGVLELDRPALDAAARIYRTLRHTGNLIEDADILIAAVALANDAILVTRNVRHFGRVAGLRLENWEDGDTP
jgi:tRNA(fMet)-specific endonuclease VapC